MKLFVTIAALISAFSANAATITSKATGNWSSTNTWNGGIVPGSGDDVIIANGHTVTIDANGQACANLTVNSGGTLKFSTNSTTNLFTVNGDFTINGTFTQNNNQGWPVDVYGNLTINGTYSTTDQDVAYVKISMRGSGGTTIGGTALSSDPGNQKRFLGLTINLASSTGVVTLQNNIYFAEVNNNTNTTFLTITQGIFNANGKQIHFQKYGKITTTANGKFAWLDSDCSYTEANLPSIYFDNPCCGSTFTVTGTIYIKDFQNPNNKDNFSFPNNTNATVYVFGAFQRRHTNETMNAGTFVWGPNSNYYGEAITGGSPPNPSTAVANGPAKINGTPNTNYVTPTAIQTAIDACSAAPDIALADNANGQVADANLNLSSINNVIYNFQIAVTTSKATLNAVSFTTTGTATSSDITNFKLWYNSTNDFATASQIGTSITTGTGAGSHSFTGLTQTINSGSTGYFWITADIASGATAGNTVSVSAITTSNLTFASGNLSGSTTAGGTQTIIALPTVTTSAASSITTTSATLNATINTNGFSTTTFFNYGLTTDYSNKNIPGTPSTIASGSSAVTLDITGLTPNTLYNFQAGGTNVYGTTYGANLTFTTLSKAPTVGDPNNATSTGFTANWSAPTGQGSEAYTYTVEVDDDINFGSIDKTVSGISSGNTSTVITGLSSATTYYFRVKVVNAGGSSAWSAVSAGILLDDADPCTGTCTPVTPDYTVSYATYVAGPFYINNYYRPGQYFYDDNNNSGQKEDGNNGADGTDYGARGNGYYGRLQMTTNTPSYASDQKYMWNVYSISVGGSTYYMIRNVSTGRYFHTGAYGDYSTGCGGAGDMNSVNLYSWDAGLVSGFTNRDNTSQPNREISYYLFNLASGNSGGVAQNITPTQASFTSQIFNRRFAWGDRPIHAECTSFNPKVYFMSSTSAAWDTRRWNFNLVPDDEKPVEAAADLIITNISNSSSSVPLGNTFTSTVTIKNQGTAAVANGTAIKVKYYFTGKYYTYNYTSGLAIGASVALPAMTITANKTTAGSPVVVTVNCDYSIPELACNDASNQLNSSNVVVFNVTLPSVTTEAATSIGNNVGTLNGNISNNGGDDINDYGFYWSTTSGFADGEGTKVQLGTSNYIGNVSYQLTGLTSGIPIYYKVYAANSIGVAYGTQQSFTPFNKSPFCQDVIYHLGLTDQPETMVALTIENFNSNTIRITLTEVSGGISLSGSTLRAYSSSTGNPGQVSTTTYSDGQMYVDLVFSPVPDKYTIDWIEWGPPGTCVARSSNYSSFIDINFNAACSIKLPTVTTSSATSVGDGVGTMNGNISNNGGVDLLDYGFYWSTTSGFADGEGTKVQLGTSNYIGNVSYQLTGLTNGIPIYYKVYATNILGTTYGLQQSFIPRVSCAISIGTGNWLTTLDVEKTGENQTTLTLGSEVTSLTQNFNIQGTPYTSYSYTTSPYGVIITWPGAPPTSFNIYLHYSTVSSSGSFQEFLITNLNGQNICPSRYPNVINPTATNITHNSATLGATVTDKGDTDLTARGTVYKTSSPVTSSDNALAEGGTSVGTYTHSRTGLNPQTLYYYAGYATNSTGTGISSESSFYTLSAPATSQASGVSASFVNTTSTGVTSIASLQLSTGATFPESGATKGGYLVIYSTGTPALVDSPNGLAPASAVAGGTSYVVKNETTLSSTTPSNTITGITGLTVCSTYNFKVIPYTWDGTNAATYNYYTTGTIGSVSLATGSTAYNATQTPWTAGTTIEAENYDYGGEGCAYSDNTSSTGYAIYRTDGQSATTPTTPYIESDGTASNGYSVAWTRAGEYLVYTIYAATAGSYDITIRLKGTGSSGCQLSVDGTNVDGLLASSGSWTSWVERTVSTTLSVGEHKLKISFPGADINIDWIKFIFSEQTYYFRSKNSFGTWGTASDW
ncbi:MAG TPA: fibronectin type III domain-containing protein, partial [Bacteroidales bacterium]|nr:fibronectin type III domain-containing protein [Bacteroidales bacterium]